MLARRGAAPTGVYVARRTAVKRGEEAIRRTRETVRWAGPGALALERAPSRIRAGTQGGHETEGARLRRSAEATIPGRGPPGPAQGRAATGPGAAQHS